MPANPSKLSRFWQELKRRKVVRLMAMYAGTAYIIMEVADIMLPRLGLPDWTVTFLIVLIIAGFPVAIILSWFFDITPEGVKKTEPVKVMIGSEDDGESGQEPEEAPEPQVPRKLLSTSNVIIAVLFVVVCILLYPNIFNPDQFREMRNEEGMITVAVLPFDNLTGDSSLYTWENGIMEFLINGLARSDELLVSSSSVITDVIESARQVNRASLTPELARKTAQKINASTYITGNYIGSENNASIMLNLVNTEEGEVIWSTRVDGDLESDYRSVLEFLSDTVRNYMEIQALKESVELDLAHAFPTSAEAYKQYINGLRAIISNDYELAFDFLKSAYALDTTFTFAAFYLAYAYNFEGSSDNYHEAIPWVRRAHDLKDRLPPAFRPWIELWFACYISEDENDIRRHCNRMYEAAIHSRLLWLDLGVTYSSVLKDFKKSVRAFQALEDLNREWKDEWRYDRYYREYAYSLLMADMPEEVDRIARAGLKINPDDGWLELYMGSARIMMKDTAELPAYRERIREIGDKYNVSEAQKEHFIGEMYRFGKDTLNAIKYYSLACELDKERLGSLDNLLSLQILSDMDPEECLRLAEYGMEKQPGWMSFPWIKGLALHKLGRNREALDILTEVEEDWEGFNKYLADDIQSVERALARSPG